MGLSHAKGLIAEGGKVMIGDLLTDEGKTAVETLGETARFTQLDVTSENDWEQAVALTEREFGPISLLVNNAGIVEYGTVVDTPPELFRRVIDINLFGTFLGMGGPVRRCQQPLAAECVIAQGYRLDLVVQNRVFDVASAVPAMIESGEPSRITSCSARTVARQ